MAVTRRQLVDTPTGPALLHIDGSGPGRLALGHGAGGGVEVPDLLAARAAALELGLQVVRVEQPWRVRGARVAAPAGQLDAAWLAALAVLEPLPCVVGGRSTGARVACRTADRVRGVRGVLCLAFPLLAPARGNRPRGDRSAELALPLVPRLVVQGQRDAFGVPAPAAGVEVQVVAGADHGFAVRRRDARSPRDVHDQVRSAVRAFLTRTLELPAPELRSRELPEPLPPAQTLT